MEAEVETKNLGDWQPDRGVGKQKQADRGRQVRYGSNHSCWQVGRMKAVAGSCRAKEGGRQGKVEKQRQGGETCREERDCGLRRRDKQTDAIQQEEPCSHLETEAGRQREGDRRYRQAGKQVESSHTDKGTEAGGCRGRQVVGRQAGAVA
jgi:hypothetical protein